MDETDFDQLVAGVTDMKRHVAGKVVRGARITEVAEPDVNVRAIREAASISQSQFAKLIGVNSRTLQNCEQHRTRPTGPARVLLKIVSNDPKAAVEAINQ
jgi:putative transcriptional regulator